MISFAKIKKMYAVSAKAFGGYRWQIMMLALLGFVSGVAEAFGLTALIPVFSLATGTPAGELDIINRSIAWFFSLFGAGVTLKRLLIFIAVLFTFKAGVLFIARYIQAVIVADFEKNMRQGMFRAVLRANWRYLSRHKLGELDQNIITDISYSTVLFNKIGTLIIILVNVAVYSLLAVNISWQIAVATVVLGMLLFVGFKSFFYKTRRISKQVTEWYKELAHYITESVVGIKSVKSLLAEQALIKKADGFFGTYRNARIRLDMYENVSGNVTNLVSIFFVLFIFAFFYKVEGFNYGSFTVIVYAIYKIFMRVNEVQQIGYKFNRLLPHLESALQYKEEAEAHKEQRFGSGSPFRFSDAVAFKDVAFSYDGRARILANLSMTLKKGEIIGLVGPSGSGKTTVVDLLLRLHTPKEGQILIDGVPIENIRMDEWRKEVGYVSQDLFLINDTVENNIRFYDEAITDEDVRAAAKAAHIDHVIEQLPKGYQTSVGERGLELSGGQRQRITLARVLARKPKILVLDEATSALDNESEKAVHEAILSLKGRVTVLIIAHRLSTVLDADRILVLNDGRIVEEGAPAALLEDTQSYFYRMHTI